MSNSIDIEILSCFCDEATDLLSKWEGVCLRIGSAPEKALFDEIFRYAHNLKGSSRTVGLESFGDFVHKVEDGITLLKSDEAIANPEVVAELLLVQTTLSEWINSLRTESDHIPKGIETILKRFQLSLKNSKSSPQTEIVPASVAAPESNTVVETKQIPEGQSESRTLPESPIAKKTDVKTSKPSSGEETVRVAAKKLDQILEMVGELSIHQSVIYHSRQLFESKSALLSHAAYLSRKLTRELYEKTLSLRMYPVQPIFQRLERSIREIAHTLGKEVNVEVHGGEVELDKTVCEKIVEPLTHMVRNSVDHGLETPDERVQSGKDRAGRVKLAAIQESNSVSLVIEDDGKGLNQDRIIQKAISKGLIREAAELKQEEIFALIFLPGFSTAEKVTDASGRGVGMDVVMRTVEELQGSVKIASEPGKGSKFIVSLPTSLSIIDSLVVRLGGCDYAVPVAMIDEIVDLKDLGIDHKQKMFKLRESVIPLESLEHYLSGLNPKAVGSESLDSALITRIGKQRVAFRVNRILDQNQIVVRKIGEGMSNVFGLAGGTILPDGQPGLIVDLLAIAKYYLQKNQPQEKTA